MTQPYSPAQDHRIIDLLAVRDGPPGPTAHCEYVVGGATASADDVEAAAQLLADFAMQVRCGEAPALRTWRERIAGQDGHSDRERQVVAVFASIGFGLPDQPGDDDHVQGHVAELLWGKVVAERTSCSGGRTFFHASDVKPDVAEPGGDGLVVYEVGDLLVFRLWEIKKHEQSGALSATINRASGQLKRRALNYIAKFTAPGTRHDGPLGVLLGDMVELWLDNSDRAGAGVAIGTSAAHAPGTSRPFQSLSTQFPDFTGPGQREGIVVAVPNFSAFAARVREIVWTGL